MRRTAVRYKLIKRITSDKEAEAMFLDLDFVWQPKKLPINYVDVFTSVWRVSSLQLVVAQSSRSLYVVKSR